MVNLYKSKLQAPLHIFCNFKATMAMFWGKMITIVQITTDPTGPCCTNDGVKYFLSVAVGKAAFWQLVSSEGCTVVLENLQLCRKQCTKYYKHKDSPFEHSVIPKRHFSPWAVKITTMSISKVPWNSFLLSCFLLKSQFSLYRTD